MAAYEIYLLGFIFDPAEMNLVQRGETHVSYEINMVRLASRIMDGDLRPVVEAKEEWKCRRRVVLPNSSGFEVETRSLSSACAEVEAEFRAMYHEHQFECLNLDREAKDKLVQAVEDVIVEEALDAVKQGGKIPNFWMTEYPPSA